MSDPIRPGDHVESGIDALYQAPLDRFTAQRNELAATLKKSGDRASADRVKALVKPGVAAWAVNQAWWRDQPACRAMLEAGGALRQAHVDHAQGRAADVRAALDRRQRAVDAVIALAVDALGGTARVTPDLRYRVAGTVESLASSGVPSGVTLGRLTTDLQSSGLDALGAMAGLPPASPSREPASKPTLVQASPPAGPAKPAVDPKAERAAREREQLLAEARAQVASCEDDLANARQRAGETSQAQRAAQAALDAVTTRLAELEREADAAREEQRVARRTLSQAVQQASEAEMNHARAARRLERANAALAGLKPDV